MSKIQLFILFILIIAIVILLTKLFDVSGGGSDNEFIKELKESIFSNIEKIKKNHKKVSDNIKKYNELPDEIFITNIVPFLLEKDKKEKSDKGKYIKYNMENIPSNLILHQESISTLDEHFPHIMWGGDTVIIIPPLIENEEDAKYYDEKIEKLINILKRTINGSILFYSGTREKIPTKDYPIDFSSQKFRYICNKSSLPNNIIKFDENLNILNEEQFIEQLKKDMEAYPKFYKKQKIKNIGEKLNYLINSFNNEKMDKLIKNVNRINNINELQNMNFNLVSIKFIMESDLQKRELFYNEQAFERTLYYANINKFLDYLNNMI